MATVPGSTISPIRCFPAQERPWSPEVGYQPAPDRDENGVEAFAYDDADYHVTPATLHGVTLTLDVLMQGLYRRGVGGEAYSLDDVEDVLLAASGHSFSDVIDGYVVHNGDFLALFGSNPTFTTLR